MCTTGELTHIQYSSNSIMTSPVPIPRIKHVLSPGSSSFLQMAEGRVFVDKSHGAITEFLDGGGQPISTFYFVDAVRSRALMLRFVPVAARYPDN